MNPKIVSGLLRLLMGFYFPFLALLALGIIAGIVGLTILVAWWPSLFCVVLLPLISLLILTLVQFGRATRALTGDKPDYAESELRLSRKKVQGLYDLVEQVAQERGLRPPDEIRLAPDTVAHVYEDEMGKEILVIGGFAIAGFSQQVLAGIIAHELSHFAAGDTRLARQGYRRAIFMDLLEYHLLSQTGSLLNPLVWIVRAYHWAYHLTWSAQSRQQEILADQQEVRQVGKEKAAAALLYTTVLSGLPWLRLSDIAESYAKANDRLEGIFAEQVRRATKISSSDWQEACRKEMKKKTGWFDSHPQLRERLAAMGVSPRKAIHLPVIQTGLPARDLLLGWPEIERQLTEWLVNLYRAHYAAKMEIAQIILGRPVYRP
jgi:Zn-dependent protease with chaperone function